MPWLLALGCLLLACSTTKTPLSAQAQQAARVENVVKELQEQMNRRNQPRILSLLAPPLEGNREFADDLAALFRRADPLRAVFVIERVWLLQPEMVRLDLHWTLHGDLKPDDDGPAPEAGGPATAVGSPRGFTTSGTARFIFAGKEPRLSAVQGDNPFSPTFDRSPLP